MVFQISLILFRLLTLLKIFLRFLPVPVPILTLIFLGRMVIPPVVGEAVEFHKIGGRGGNRTRVFDYLLVRGLQAFRDAG